MCPFEGASRTDAQRRGAGAAARTGEELERAGTLRSRAAGCGGLCSGRGVRQRGRVRALRAACRGQAPRCCAVGWRGCTCCAVAALGLAGSRRPRSHDHCGAFWDREGRSRRGPAASSRGRRCVPPVEACTPGSRGARRPCSSGGRAPGFGCPRFGCRCAVGPGCCFCLEGGCAAVPRGGVLRRSRRRPLRRSGPQALRVCLRARREQLRHPSYSGPLT